MKVGTLTFHDAINYGAVLQSFALVETLNKLGVTAHVIDYRNSKQQELYDPIKIKQKLIANLKTSPIRGTLRLFRYLFFHKRNYTVKFDKFNEFINSRINLFPLVNNSVSSIKENFDALICGSDQIWNPSILTNFDPVYFLQFDIDKKVKHISYAASSGSVEILQNKSDFFDLLSNFDSISVREKSLNNYITQNSDFHVTTVIDPTLLLEDFDYRKILNYELNQIYPKKYNLIYSLSGNETLIKFAKKISEETETEVIEISSAYYQNKNFKNHVNTAGPMDFIHLFDNSEIVITDSFHGVCISIIFKKQFYCALANNRNSRIVDLLSDLNLTNRIINTDMINSQLSPIDYNAVYNKLTFLRKKSIDFLRNSLNIDNQNLH